MIQTVKGFGIVKTEVNVFLELSSRTARTYTGLGKQTLGGHKQGNDPDLPMSVQESLEEVWVGCGLLQSWGH